MHQDHLSLLASLLAGGVEFVVVGGVAVNAHGYVRATNDIDFFIRATEENAEATYRALVAAGVSLPGVEPLDILNDESHLRFGEDGRRVDILTSIGELTFDRVWRNRIEIELVGLRIPFICKSDLLENKREIGRLRDLADVEELECIPERFD
jgi:predicted nucleotidyltransferase